MKIITLKKCFVTAIAGVIGILSSYGYVGEVVRQGNMFFVINSEKAATAELIYHFGREENVIVPDKIHYHGKDYIVRKIAGETFSEEDHFYIFDNKNNRAEFIIEPIIKAIYLPESINNLGYPTFYNLHSLQSLMLPNNLEKMECTGMLDGILDFVVGRNVKNCNFYLDKIVNLYMLPSSPPRIDETLAVFPQNLYLPKGCYDDYYNFRYETDYEFTTWERVINWAKNVYKSIPSRLLIPSQSKLVIPAGIDYKFWFYFMDNEGNNIEPSEVTLTSDDIDLVYENGAIRCMTPGHGSALLSVTDSDGTVATRELDVNVKSRQITIDDIIYEVTDQNEHEVGVYSYQGTGGNVVIPSSILIDDEEYTVTRILDFAFKEYPTKVYKWYNYESRDYEYKYLKCPHILTGVRLPSTIRTIGTSAFEDCNNLTTIYLPDGVEVIGNFAFKDASLKNVVIGKNVGFLRTDIFDCQIDDFYCFPTTPPTTFFSTFLGTAVKNFYVDEQLENFYRMMWPSTTSGEPFANNEGRWNHIMGNTLPMPEKILIPSNTEIKAVPGAEIPLWFDFVDKEGNPLEIQSYEWRLLNNCGTVVDDTLILDQGSDVLQLTITDMDGETFTRLIPVAEDTSEVTPVIDEEMIGMPDDNQIIGVYNLQGQKVASNIEDLTNGMYIVKYPRHSKKIVVSNY